MIFLIKKERNYTIFNSTDHYYKTDEDGDIKADTTKNMYDYLSAFYFLKILDDGRREIDDTEIDTLINILKGNYKDLSKGDLLNENY